jgi:alpha-L-rhamnosidase
MSAIVGKPTGDLADRIKAAFQSQFVGSDGAMPGDTQAGYALALYYGLIPEELRSKVFDRLLVAIERAGNKLTTGFLSTLPAMMVLSEFGRNDIAYRLVLNREFPGWLYSVDNGATTIWERWDGYVKGRGFQDPGMNSLNHWAFGAVGEWMMKTIIGISPDESEVGYKRFHITTKPGGNMTWAKGSLETPFGLIRIEWTVDGPEYRLTVVVPPNSTAIVERTGQRLLAGRHELRFPID